MLKKTNLATIYPQKGSRGKPISINWSEKGFLKVVDFFIKVTREAAKEKNPRIYRQIIFFYEGESLKWLKPFNI